MIKDNSTQIEDRVNTLESQVKSLTNTIVRQDALISKLKAKEAQAELKNVQNNLVIHGITESKEENCVHMVEEFFKNVLKITETVQVQDAFRLGKKDKSNRPMLIKLHSSKEKGKVYSNIKLLKEVWNEKNQKYKIWDHLPAREAAIDCCQCSLKWQNNR